MVNARRELWNRGCDVALYVFVGSLVTVAALVWAHEIEICALTCAFDVLVISRSDMF